MARWTGPAGCAGFGVAMQCSGPRANRLRSTLGGGYVQPSFGAFSEKIQARAGRSTFDVLGSGIDGDCDAEAERGQSLLKLLGGRGTVFPIEHGGR